MSLPRIASRDEWLTARKALLAKEKELTRQRDSLNAERRNLPMVEVTKDYPFEGPDGTVGLTDLFEGRPQLIIYHFMFHPEWEDGCPSCTAGTDELSPGFLTHLHTRETSYAMVSRAPLAKLERWKAIKGWDLPWYSSNGSDFNYDFGVTIDESVRPGRYNFRTKEEYEAMGSDFFSSDQPFDMPGRSCFLQADGRVFHTYSQYARGLESTGGSYYFLDLTALGRRRSGRSRTAAAARRGRQRRTSPHRPASGVEGGQPGRLGLDFLEHVGGQRRQRGQPHLALLVPPRARASGYHAVRGGGRSRRRAGR